MKKLLITFGALIILTSCGYSSEEECRLKEMQKCDSKSCENQAYLYCSDEFPRKSTTKRYIYDKKNYPLNWVTVNVDSFKVYIQETKPRKQDVLVCIDKAWTIGKGKCKTIWLNSRKSYPQGRRWEYTDSGADIFYKYINESGDGLNQGTIINVYEIKSVGFFRYYLGWIYYWFLWGAAILIVIVFLTSFFNSEPKTEDEVEVEDEEIEEAEENEDAEGEMVEIPEREELELMTKVEIKEWADAFGYNVPMSLSKEEMVERFVQKTNLYIEEELKKLKNLYDKGLIDEELYNEKQKELLD